ncbi:MAG: lytic transglycosylase domain-containing protein [Flavobacteriales bacterium]|nr:lytic transglycosylase domain-containing protein [Flavobacteriales bacterium]MCX7768347.1 lytic transglycosylase domain-containing protein [Flavobacteriales bacterium]MDW8409093.1 lytic transglycosylase domain-containing protein [Flavobacteriales bacterium]
MVHSFNRIGSIWVSGAAILAAFGMATFLNGKLTSTYHNEEIKSPVSCRYCVNSPELMDQINFAGEPVPLADYEVRERLEREILENTFRHAKTLLILKKAGRYFPVIEKILSEEGVPDDFKYLCVIESELSNVVSPAGAAGFWQFLKSTALEYGLEVNDEVDERYHLEKATRAACRFLKDARSRLGSWTNAAASYNMGMGGFQVKQSEQKQSSYYNLYLNQETSRYVFRILALKYIMKFPAYFNFDIQENQLFPPIPLKEVEVDSAVTSWIEFALAQGTTYKHLLEANPWIRKPYLRNPKRKKYKVLIPQPFNYKEAQNQIRGIFTRELFSQ